MYPNHPQSAVSHEATVPGSQPLKKERGAQGVALLTVKEQEPPLVTFSGQALLWVAVEPGTLLCGEHLLPATRQASSFQNVSNLPPSPYSNSVFI